MSRDFRVLIALFRTTNTHRFMRGVYRYAGSQEDWRLDAIFHDPCELQIRDIRERGADGLIVSCSPSIPTDLEFLSEYQGPVVSLTPDTPWTLAPHVTSNLPFAYSQIVNHFQFLGRRHMAYLGLECRAPSRMAAPIIERLSAEAGMQCSVLLRPTTPDDELMTPPRRPEDIPPVVRDWLGTLPKGTAILCRSDADGCAIVRAAAVLGRSVPEDLAVAGIGDDPIATTASPSLTTFELPHEEIGFQAAALLDRMMRGHPRPDEPIVIEGGQPIIRGSTQQHSPDVQRALAIIREHATTGLTVKELCRQMGVSRVTLERRFTATLSYAPGEAIRLGRLDAARRLLDESDLTVESVASRSGFESTSSFSKFFRERTGHSPGEYRDMRRRRETTIAPRKAEGD